MENLIPAVNKLQEVISLSNVKMPIELPCLVVVGSQSSGKSSVLESIVGRDFLPRGTGIVTRCPLILRLIRSNFEQDYATFSHLPNDCRFTDFTDVRKELETMNREIATSSGVSSNEIFLNIYSSKVVDLTLIDLPGLIKNPIRGQSSDLDKRINSMILEYAKKSNSIILAISPANNDLANSDALNIARQVDPDGNRTIGVFTKIDIMDKGTDALEMVEGLLYRLKLGYVGVVCRSQQDIIDNLPLEEHLEKEMEFFANHPKYKKISHKLGIRYLRNRLSEIFKQHLQVTVPKLKLEIENLITGTNKELKELGNSIESQAEQNEMIFKVISEFCKAFEDCIDGRDLENCFKEFTGGSKIMYIFKNFYYEEIAKVETIERIPDYEIRIAMLNATGIKGVLFIPETAFENLVIDIIKRFEKPSQDCLFKVKDELLKIISSIKIIEFRRFPRLHENMIKLAIRVIEDFLPNTESHINSIVECESNYLNISHPDFISVKEASEIARQLIDQAAKEPKSKASKKQGEVKSQGWSIWGSKYPEPKFEEVGPAERIENCLGDEMTPEELEQILSVKILIENYLGIVKKNIGDVVPKCIMRNLVNKSRNNMQKVLIGQLHGNKEFLDELFEESPGIMERRNSLKAFQQSLTLAIQALSTV
jgi:dynamin 1-like protein